MVERLSNDDIKKRATRVHDPDKTDYENPRLVKGPHETVAQYYERATCEGFARHCSVCSRVRPINIVRCIECGGLEHDLVIDRKVAQPTPDQVESTPTEVPDVPILDTESSTQETTESDQQPARPKRSGRKSKRTPTRKDDAD